MWGKKSSKDLTQDLHLTLRSIYLWLLKPHQKWSQKRPRYAKESSLESYILYFHVCLHMFQLMAAAISHFPLKI